MGYFDEVIDWYGINSSAEFKENISQLLDLCSSNSDISEICSYKKENFSNLINFESKRSLLEEFVEITQKCFFIRKGERWEQKSPSWIRDNVDKISVIIDDLGLCLAKIPKAKIYNKIAIFGATAPEIEKRINFLVKLIEQQQIAKPDRAIYLLTGERYLTPAVDGGEAIINHLREVYKITNVTEAHLMEQKYLNLTANSVTFKDIRYEVVNTPRGDKSRPNTQDTIAEFFTNHVLNQDNILFIGRAPNLLPFDEDIKKTIKQMDITIDYELVGAGCYKNQWNSDEEAFYQMLMPLGGAFYGGYERIVIKLSEKYSDVCYTQQELLLRKASIGSKKTS